MKTLLTIESVSDVQALYTKTYYTKRTVYYTFTFLLALMHVYKYMCTRYITGGNNAIRYMRRIQNCFTFFCVFTRCAFLTCKGIIPINMFTSTYHKLQPNLVCRLCFCMIHYTK